MVDPNQVNLTDYLGSTFRRHQEDRLGQLGYTGFDKKAFALVSFEMKNISLRTKPVYGLVGCSQVR